jgi:hypothetical protein
MYGLDPGIHPCISSARHIPRISRTVKHHIVPESWGGPTVDSNLVDLCDNHHYNVHTIIDEYVRLSQTTFPRWVQPNPTWLGRFDATSLNLSRRAITEYTGTTIPGYTL